MQIYSSFSGAGLMVLSMGDGLPTHLPSVSRSNIMVIATGFEDSILIIV
jgi:hypothetical protein